MQQRPVDLAIDAHRLDLAGEEEERPADDGGLGGRDAGEEGDGQPDADEACFHNLSGVHPAGGADAGSIAPSVRNSLRNTSQTTTTTAMSPKTATGESASGESRIGNPRRRSDHHVLRIAGDRRHAAAVGGGGGRNEIGNRVAPKRTHDLHDDRRHHEADRVIDQKGGKHAGENRDRDQEDERRMGVLDRERPQGPERARDFQVRHHDHHADQERDGVEVDGAEGLIEAQGAERDHRRAAEEGDARAVEAQAGNAAGRDPDIGRRQG